MLFKLLIPWSSSVKAVAIYLKLKDICIVSSGNHAMCLPLECWKSQSFLVEIATFKYTWMETFCSMEVELTWMGLWNGAVEGMMLFKERGVSGAGQSVQKTLDMWANCVLKHCLSLKTFIPNLVAFFVSLGIVISCIRKMSFSIISAKQEFSLALVSLSTSQGVDNVH